jgi:hypothetical protein
MKGLWKGGLTIVVIGAASLFIGAAWAHPPFCVCKMIDATTVGCEGGFADGTGVPGVRLDVVRYDESIILQTSFGIDSTVSFRKPDGEFYMLFDAGPGQSFDVDYKDIQ